MTHVDGSGRLLQTVSEKANPRYLSLISEFEKLTGVPVVLNTSFNEDEPLVCTPPEAINCFFSGNTLVGGVISDPLFHVFCCFQGFVGQRVISRLERGLTRGQLRR